MGTLLNRRRYMGGGGTQSYIPASNYIQDGLIFQLDGIEYGDIVGHWIDLKQSGDFTMDSRAMKNDYGFLFPAVAQGNYIYCEMDGGIANLPSYTDFTIEYVYQDRLNGSASGAEVVLFNTKSIAAGPFIRSISTSNIIFAGKYIWPYQNAQNKPKSTPAITAASATVTITANNLGVVNKEEVTLTNNGAGYGAGSAVYIGSQNNCEYTLCAIRIYNRNLTKEEISFNQDLDKIRFKL